MDVLPQLLGEAARALLPRPGPVGATYGDVARWGVGSTRAHLARSAQSTATTWHPVVYTT